MYVVRLIHAMLIMRALLGLAMYGIVLILVERLPLMDFAGRLILSVLLFETVLQAAQLVLLIVVMATSQHGPLIVQERITLVLDLMFVTAQQHIMLLIVLVVIMLILVLVVIMLIIAVVAGIPLTAPAAGILFFAINLLHFHVIVQLSIE